MKRDYVEVDDLCRVVQQFLRHPFPGVVNVATGKETTITDLVTTVGAVSGISFGLRFLPTQSAQGDLVFDTGRLRSLYPDVRFKNLEQGIRGYIDGVSE